MHSLNTLIVPTERWATDAEAFGFIHEQARLMLRGDEGLFGLHAIRQVAHLCEVRAQRREIARQAGEHRLTARIRQGRSRLCRAWKAFVKELYDETP